MGSRGCAQDCVPWPKKKAAAPVSLTEDLDLTTPIGRAMAGLLSVFADFEPCPARLWWARMRLSISGREQMKVLAGLEVTARAVERTSVVKKETARRLIPTTRRARKPE